MGHNTSISLLLVLSICFMPVNGFCEHGCCSRHDGVCGDRCCDGTSLSAKCKEILSGYSNTPENSGTESSAEPSEKKSSVIRTRRHSNMPENSGTESFGEPSAISNSIIRTPSIVSNNQKREAIIDCVIVTFPEYYRSHLKLNKNIIIDGMAFSERTKTKLDVKSLKEIYMLLVQELKEKKYNQPDTVKSFGVLAGAVIECVYPDSWCKYFDTAMNAVRYDGFQEVRDIGNEISELQKVYPYPCQNRQKKDVEIFQNEVLGLYNIAVNKISDIWLSAWKEAGYKVEPLVSAGWIQVEKKDPLK